MDPNTQLSEIKEDIRKLQEFKHRLEKQIYAAVAVAAVLGGLGFFGVTWINKIEKKLDSANNRTEQIEKKTSNWDAQIAEGLQTIREAKESAIKEIESRGNKLVENEIQGFEKKIRNSKDGLDKYVKSKESYVKRYIQEIEKEGKIKTEEIKSIKASDLLEILKNGSQTLTLSGLNINNGSGRTVVAIYPDNSKDGDGYIRINNQDGDRRLIFYLDNDRPQALFSNTNNKVVLKHGIYNDSEIGYLRFYSSDGETKLAEIDSADKGGSINLYHKNGRSIIYIGPENNSGNGLINATTKDGVKTVSHGP